MQPIKDNKEFKRLIGGALPMLPEHFTLPEGCELVIQQSDTPPPSPGRVIQTIRCDTFNVVFYVLAPESDDPEF